jgi:DNA modification methylase
MQIIYKNIKDIKKYKNNPRKNELAVEKVAESIKEFGFRNPILIDKDNEIVCGHTRYDAAKKLGIKEVPCIIADDLTPDQIKAFRLVDNKTNEFAEWDDELLDLEIQDIEIDLSPFGFEKGLDKLPGEIIEDEFDGELPTEPISKLGDIYKLGNHRLMCGDTTNPQDFAKLMQGRVAQVCVTSPPYGVGKEYEKKGIETWLETMQPAIKNITKYSGIVCWNLGDLYATGTQFIEPTLVYSVNLFNDCGFRPIWIRIWKKQGMNFGVGPYHLVTNKPVQQYEYISAFSNKGDIEYNDQEYVWLSAFAGHAYKFVKRLTKEERKKWGYSGIWEMTTVRSNKEHPAMFPVELPWRCIKMHSDKGGIVLEPFSGSGTTIIAAEQADRVCYAMEREAAYVDLAVKRWEAFTGKKAEKIV